MPYLSRVSPLVRFSWIKEAAPRRRVSHDIESTAHETCNPFFQVSAIDCDTDAVKEIINQTEEIPCENCIHFQMTKRTISTSMGHPQTSRTRKAEYINEHHR